MPLVDCLFDTYVEYLASLPLPFMPISNRVFFGPNLDGTASLPKPLFSTHVAPHLEAATSSVGVSVDVF